MKKILVLLLSLIMFTGAFCGISAECAVYPELIGNGGFEKVTNGIPDVWYASGGWGGANVTLDRSKAQNGTYSAKITAAAVTNPYVSYVVAVSANTRYKISAGIMAELTGDGKKGAAFKLEYYKGTTCTAENSLGGEDGSHYTSNTNEMWTPLVTYVETPAQCTLMKICCRLYTTGTVWFDDVSAVREDGADTFTMKTSHSVHYTDDATPGTASVLVSNGADSSKDGLYTADFTVFNDSSQLTGQANTAFIQGKAEYSYNPQLMAKETLYTLKITVRNTTGVAVFEKTRRIMLFDRPTRLDREGNYIINGEKFNPVFGYHVNVDDYPRMKEVGINVVQISFGYSSIASNPTNVAFILEELEKYDLYGMFCIYLDMKFAADPANIRNTRLITNALKDYDRVFAWVIMDEPCGAGITEEKHELLAQSYYEVRKNDPNHPVFFCDYTIDYYEEEIKYCDIFAPDIYSRSQTRIKDQTEAAIEAANGKPVYTIVRTYGDSNNTLPKKEEIPHFVYQAFLAGAKGIGFYSISDGLYHGTTNAQPIYNTDRWETMTRLAGEYLQLFELFGGNTPYTDTQNSGFLIRSFSGGPVMYLSQGGGTYSMPLNGKDVQFIAGNENLIQTDSGQLTLSGSGWQAVLLRTVEQGQRVVFSQGGAVINKTLPGKITVSSTVKGGVLFAKLIRGSLISDIKINENDGYAALEIRVPDDGEDYTLQAFLWNGFENITPLTKKAEIKRLPS